MTMNLISGGVPISILYAGINGLLILILAYRVVSQRRQTETIFGTGDNDDMARAVRVHGNSIEYIPVALIMIGALELMGVSLYLVHSLGIGITVGRLLHAWGFSGESGVSFGRYYGTVLTWLTYLVGSISCIYVGVTALTG